MNDRNGHGPAQPGPSPQAAVPDIPELLGEIYEAAPAPERVSLIEHLMSPLSLLSAFAVANGVFARLWFQRGFQDNRIFAEDTYAVGRADVTALASFVQQVSVETIDGIAQVVANSPVLAATAAAALLIAAIGRKLGRSRDTH